MSYDLMVFDPAAAPASHAAFVDWYQKVTEWSDDLDYEDPSSTAPILQGWYRDMIKQFPAMNGPDFDEANIDNPKITGYTCVRSAIYCDFRWSEAEAAYAFMLALARRHGVGFFDASGEGDVWLPDVSGSYSPIPRN